jgi:uncharacterized protein (TIGR01244 family)
VRAGKRERFLRAAAKIAGAAILAVVAFGGRTAAVPPDAAGSLPESVEPSVIPNYSRLRPDLATAGQPTEVGLRRLRELGFRIIIDLRAPAEGTAAEKAAVEAAGLRYVSVPVMPETFRREDVDAVARILDEPGRGPVLLHCATGNRVGGVWTVLQATKGRPYEDAEAEGRKIGLRGAPMIAAVRRVLGPEPAIH